jgi:hypothetical protein
MALLVAVGCDDGAADDGRLEATTAASATPSADLQDVILNDGVVTTAEIEQAHRVAVQCITAAGFDASFERNLAGQYQISIAIPRGLDSASFESAMDDVVDACSEKYLDRVSLVYDAQSR